jgi:putative membrane protein (TIGR04086 family)
MGKIRKGMLCGIVLIGLFFAAPLVGALIIRVTPIPESWGYGYMIGVISAICFLAAFFISYINGKAGLITGLGVAVFVIIIVKSILSFIFDGQMGFGEILHAEYLIPACFGMAGGIVGVNRKK